MDISYSKLHPVLNIDFLRSRRFSPQLSYSRNSPTNFTSDGLLKTAEANVPVHGFVNNEKRGLFIEPGSTNLFPNSNIVGASAGTAVGSYTTLAPDGKSIAQSIVEIAGNTEHYNLDYVSTVYAGNTYVESVYAKALPTNTEDCGIILRFAKPVTDNSIQSQVAFMFNKDGTITTSAALPETAGAEYVGNGWWRLWHKKLLPSTQDTYTIRVQLTSSLNIGANNLWTTVYPGRTNHGFYLWGRQIEISGRATSLITTGASQVTRPPAIAVIDSIANKINQTNGTLVLDYMVTNNPRDYIAVGSIVENTSSLTRSISLRHTLSNKIQAIGWNQVATPAIDAKPLGQTNRIAVSYSPQEVVLCANGAISRIGHVMGAPALTKLLLGHIVANSAIVGMDPITIEKLSYYDASLSDANLVALCR